MVAFILLGLMVDPVLIKIVTRAQSTKTQNRLSASETPTGASHFHAIFDQVAAGTFNDSRSDGKSLRKVMVVLEVGRMVEQVVRATIQQGITRPFSKHVQRLTGTTNRLCI